MLDSIQIKNFAIIDSLQLDFEAGMSALTGETGAGKSILLDALKLVAGDRAETETIRSGQARAEISVCFNLEDCGSAANWLLANDMDADGECVIRRVLSDSGRSRAFINGHNATLIQLRELCEQLVDIHGQHEHQSLQKSSVQRGLLDAYLAQPQLLDEVKQKYALYRELEHRYEQAQSGSQEREQRIDLLGLYCEELNQLSFTPAAFENLQNDYRRLSNAGNLAEKTGIVLGRLSGDENLDLQSALSLSAQDLGELLVNDDRLAASHELITAASIQVQEAIIELRQYRDTIELDDGRLDAVNDQIANMQNLARKHRVEVTALAAVRSDLKLELEQLSGSAFDLDTIQVDLQKALDDYRFSAGELSLKRQQTAGLLSEQITTVMQQLGMEGGHFRIEVTPDQSPGSHGTDAISYRVSANPGQPAKSLARVASGGELSRISLAIQVIMSESSHIPTLIFDEVDSGVGGGVAHIVGKKLRLLGNERQVLCVTHLPQVASQAHHHFRVEKSSRDNHTSTDVLALGEKDRLEEIARMLGGINITEQTRAHASEMIATQE